MGIFGAVGSIVEGYQGAERELRAKSLTDASAFINSFGVEPFDIEEAGSESENQKPQDANSAAAFMGEGTPSEGMINPQVLRIWRSILLWFAQKGLDDNGYKADSMDDDQKTIYLGLIRLMAGQIHVMSGENKALIDMIVVPVADQLLYGGGCENPKALAKVAEEQDVALASGIKVFIKAAQMGGALDKAISKQDAKHLDKFNELLKFFMETAKPVARAPDMW